MTCIVGIVHKQAVYIGGDSASCETESFDRNRIKQPKVFVNGPMLIGWCGSFRMGQLLQYSLKIPTKPKLMDDMRFMTTRFIDEVRRCFSNNGYGFTPEHEDNEGGTFLVGFNGKLYEVQDDFQVSEWERDYAAIGSGGRFALGSLYMTEDIEPVTRITKALEAAEHFNSGVVAPFYVMKQSLPLSKKTRK